MTGFGMVGTKALTVKFVMTSSARIGKAHVRRAQGNTTSRIRRGTVIGKMIPPGLDPVNIMPKAAPRSLWQQPAAHVTAVILLRVSTGDGREKGKGAGHGQT